MVVFKVLVIFSQWFNMVVAFKINGNNKVSKGKRKRELNKLINKLHNASKFDLWSGFVSRWR